MGLGPHGPLITPHMLYTCNYKEEIVPLSTQQIQQHQSRQAKPQE